jgi:hypothetical protein
MNEHDIATVEDVPLILPPTTPGFVPLPPPTDEGIVVAPEVTTLPVAPPAVDDSALLDHDVDEETSGEEVTWIPGTPLLLVSITTGPTHRCAQRVFFSRGINWCTGHTTYCFPGDRGYDAGAYPLENTMFVIHRGNEGQLEFYHRNITEQGSERFRGTPLFNLLTPAAEELLHQTLDAMGIGARGQEHVPFTLPAAPDEALARTPEAPATPRPDDIVPGRNPARVTYAQLGDGYRLIEEGEFADDATVPDCIQYRPPEGNTWESSSALRGSDLYYAFSYRVPSVAPRMAEEAPATTPAPAPPAFRRSRAIFCLANQGVEVLERVMPALYAAGLTCSLTTNALYQMYGGEFAIRVSPDTEEINFSPGSFYRNEPEYRDEYQFFTDPDTFLAYAIRRAAGGGETGLATPAPAPSVVSSPLFSVPIHGGRETARMAQEYLFSRGIYWASGHTTPIYYGDPAFGPVDWPDGNMAYFIRREGGRLVFFAQSQHNSPPGCPVFHHSYRNVAEAIQLGLEETGAMSMAAVPAPIPAPLPAMTLRPVSVEIPNERVSRMVQELLFQIGARWFNTGVGYFDIGTSEGTRRGINMDRDGRMIVWFNFAGPEGIPWDGDDESTMSRLRGYLATGVMGTVLPGVMGTVLPGAPAGGPSLPPPPMSDAMIERECGAALFTMIRTAPAAPVTRGTIRAKLRLILPAEHATTPAILEWLREQLAARMPAPMPGLVSAPRAYIPPPPAPGQARSGVSAWVDFTEEEIGTCRYRLTRAGSEEYELSHEELAEIAADVRNDGEDFSDFVSRVAEKLRQEAYDNPPDDTAYLDALPVGFERFEASHTDDSEVSLRSLSTLRSHLRNWVQQNPDLDPERDDEDEDDD